MERVFSVNDAGGSQINHIMLKPQLWPDEGLGTASSIYSADDGFLQSSHTSIGSASHFSHQLPCSRTDAFEVFSFCRSLDDFAPCLDAAKFSILSEIEPKRPSIQATSTANQSPTLNLGRISSSSCKNPANSSKGRKMQEKRIICVPLSKGIGRQNAGSERHPSDIYAWRKYGQKPIKGSPYPRGYYRCSSCKGCSARKQVEISKDDPSMLTITYTSDHNHPDQQSSASHAAPASTQEKTITSRKKIASKPGRQEEGSSTSSEALQTGDCSMGSSSSPASCMLMQDPLAADAAAVMKSRISNPDMKRLSDNFQIANCFPASQELEAFFAGLEELAEFSTSFGITATKGEPLEGQGKYESDVRHHH